MFITPAILDQIQTSGLMYYCPQDSTGFYDFDFSIVYKQDTANYCPEDTVACYPSYTIVPPSLITSSSILWLDADDATTITESGGLISQWNDKSTSLNHATQLTTANKPTYNLNDFNDRNSVNFIGNDYFSLTSAITGIDVRTVFVVGSRVANTNLLISLTGADPGFFPYDLFLFSDTNFYVSDSNNAIYAGASTVLDFQFCDIFNNDNGVAYIDGNLQTPIVASATTTVPSFSVVGARLSTGNYSTGKILELIYFNSVLSTANRELIEGYLAYKWSLVDNLPVSHPYKTTLPPGVTLGQTCLDIYQFDAAP